MQGYTRPVGICLSVICGGALLYGQAQPSRSFTETTGTAIAEVNRHAAAGSRRITLEDARQQAGERANPLVRLGELQVEAARQHRLGTESEFFPKISAGMFNLHFNKFLGEEFTVQRPRV